MAMLWWLVVAEGHSSCCCFDVFLWHGHPSCTVYWWHNIFWGYNFHKWVTWRCTIMNLNS